MTSPLSVVVLYCSQEKDLIHRVIEPLTKISKDIVVVSLTHYFTGEEDPEAVQTLQELKETYSIIPVVIPWKYIPGAPQNFWPKEMRLHGLGATQPDTGFVLFVDSDEILSNPTAFMAWYATLDSTSEKSYKLANYWYFLSERRRAKVVEDSIILVPRFTLRLSMFRVQGQGERELLVKNPVRQVRGLGNEVMFDHYSWVRPKEVLLQKVTTWGHRNDKDWLSLVRKALSEDPLTTHDFVHGYEYEIL
jgi:hypothetical protein